MQNCGSARLNRTEEQRSETPDHSPAQQSTNMSSQHAAAAAHSAAAAAAAAEQPQSAREASTSRVLFHYADDDSAADVVDRAASAAPPAASAVRMKRLPSARSSAAASEIDELEEDAAALLETTEAAKAHNRPSPMLTAGWLSRLGWLWLTPLVDLGTKKVLEESDLFACMPVDQARGLMDTMQEKLTQVKADRHKVEAAAAPGASAASKPNGGDYKDLWKTMWRQFGARYSLLQIILIIYTGCKIVQPLMLNQLVLFIGDESVPRWKGFVYALAMGAGALGQALCHHQIFFHLYRVGVDVRIALNGLIYEKALKLRTTHMMKTTTGQVINLVSNDSAKMEDLAIYMPYLWNCPMECAIVLGLLYQQVGVAAFAGFGAVLCLTPMQLFFSHLFGKYRRYTVVRTDLRVKTINEILVGADVLKMMNWEQSLEDKVNEVRREEFESISRAARLKSINQAAFFTSMSIVNLVVFFTMHFRGVAFTPANVFTTVSLFNIVKFPLCNFIPFAVERLTEANIALRRITTFLDLDDAVANDQKKYDRQISDVAKANAEMEQRAKVRPEEFAAGSIHMENVACVWELTEEMDPELQPAGANGHANGNAKSNGHANGGKSSGKTAAEIEMVVPLRSAPPAPSDKRQGLRGLDVSLAPGALVGIIGSIGAYKSSFLAACLGEMTQLHGAMKVSGRVAYASQVSWIFAGSIRENILFGREFDAKRYMRTVRACQLVEDIRNCPQGDQTQIGEKGVNLSGGQRARLSCARAVYGDCDVYLFDDPLAALDAVVARKLFDEVIGPRGMLAGRTRLLVTHQTHLLTQAHILMLEHGRIKSQGSFDELVARGFLEEQQRHAQQDNDSGIAEAESKKRRKDARDTRRKKKEARDIALADKSDSAAGAAIAPGTQAEAVPTSPKPSTSNDIVRAETSTVGTLDLRVFLKLFRAGGGNLTAFAVFFLVLLGQAAAIVSDKWLANWSAQSEDQQTGEDFYSFVYLGLVLATITLGVLRARLFFIFILRAASELHKGMFHAVVYSPMRFFEANPIGRILNRFAKDQSTVDEMLPLTFFDFAQCFFLVIGSLVVVGMSAPYILLCIIPIIPLFVYVRQRFMFTSRELKRMDAVSRSPVYAHFSSTLSGLMVIRSFKTERSFVEGFLSKIDENTRAFLTFHMTARWFGLRLDAIAASLVVALALFIAGTRGTVSPANAGFALSYVLMLTALFQWAVRQSAEVETMMTSVERIVEYAELPPEGALINASYRPPAGWPAQGQIEFRDYKMRYRAGLDLVLKGVSFTVQPGEKVGVCGRTGAGKSSLFQALLRLVEGDSSGGGIFIDGMEIGRLGLSDLRSNLAIIPQYPVIFSGSLRYNLTPFGGQSDAQLWAALEAVQLKAMVSGLRDGLDAEMAEFGGNFSVGECQLICVARALLKPSRILLVDEATANVDSATDALIQSVIREKFADRTVLTIAHRLGTILDSTKIIVMAAGKVAEMGTPAELLARPPADISADPSATFGLFSFMANQKKAAH